MSWAKFDDGYDDNPKCRAAGKDGRALDSAGIRHCARNRTDGLIADYDLPVLAAKADVNAKRTVTKLIEVRRWHGPHHDCERCPDCPPGYFIVHDYLDYNPSAEQDLAKRRARAEAGRKGGVKSRPPSARVQASTTNGAGNSEAIASIVASPELEQTGSKNGTPYPVTPSLTLTETPPWSVGETSEPPADTPAPGRRKRSERKRPEADHHPESERLCQLLHDSLDRRGYLVKPVSDAWLTEMDRIIRIDGREPQRIEGFVNWLDAGQHKVALFWRSNIRSPQKLRQQWDRIREERDDHDASVRQRSSKPSGGNSTNRAWEESRRLLEQPEFRPDAGPQLRVVNG